MKKLFFVLALFFVQPAVCFGADSFGCYTDRATGRYECVRGQHRGESFSSQGDMLRQMRARDTYRMEESSGRKQLAPLQAPTYDPGPDRTPDQLLESRLHRRRPTPPYPVRVLEISDGATVIAEPAGKPPSKVENRLTIRLYGIDCPEIDQPYGQQAAALLRKTALHKMAEVRRGPINKDKAGRTVAIVDVEAHSLQETLLRDGLASVSAGCLHPECEEWKKLEGEARTAGLGLWKQ